MTGASTTNIITIIHELGRSLWLLGITVRTKITTQGNGPHITRQSFNSQDGVDIETMNIIRVTYH